MPRLALVTVLLLLMVACAAAAEKLSAEEPPSKHQAMLETACLKIVQQAADAPIQTPLDTDDRRDFYTDVRLGVPQVYLTWVGHTFALCFEYLEGLK